MAQLRIGEDESRPARAWPAFRRCLSFRWFPAWLFGLVSLAQGIATIFVMPPLRSADENAHFLRAQGLWQGEILARGADADGRRGFWLPQRLHSGYALYDAARLRVEETGQSFREAFAAVSRQEASSKTDAPYAFALYGGSEAYSPVPYLPYVMAAAAADFLQLDFRSTLYLMRCTGLIILTAVIAYAIAITPVLPWAFLATAMLPAAASTRAAVSADGMTLASSLIVLAFCLRAALGTRANEGAQRFFWLTISCLTKPSQVAFVLLDFAARPLRALRKERTSAALIMLPGVALTVAWMLLTGGEIASWRLHGQTGAVPEQFSPLWKLRFMLEHPLHFPTVFLNSVDYSGEWWRQLIGVLGWLDTPLPAWAYALLTILLLAGCLGRIDADQATRRRIAVVAALTSLVYVLLVFLIFFVTSTTVEADRIHGVQGRYFLVAVPVLAAAAAALLRWRPPPFMPAGAAIVSALLSSAALIDAIVRKDWS